MTRYLDLEDILGYLVDSGLMVKDAGLLDSAIHRPRASLFGQDAYPTLDLKAAALLHSVAQNQTLVDGNKRLALLCTHVFVSINGHEMGAQDAALFDLMIQMAHGLSDVRTIADQLALRPRSPSDTSSDLRA